MAAYSPPFTLTHAMMSRVEEIAELVGQWRATQSSQVPMLRRENRIRTIQVSLAIGFDPIEGLVAQIGELSVISVI